ncbi:MAG: hypothetical protein R3214_12500 [Christiangramia sp.]|nr:hypothetical protein [Christiangramia sp.]
MTVLSNIIQDFAAGREGNSTHRKPFLNAKSTSNRMCWYSRRRYA